MDRIQDPTAAAGDQFTEGNPAIPIPATIARAVWLNNVQNELVSFIEAQGITPDTGDETQVAQAIAAFVGTGGVQTNFTIVNNQNVALDLTGLVFDKVTIKSVRILFDIHRESVGNNLNEMGELFVLFDPVADDWILSFDSKFDDSEVIFTITAAGQIQYTSSNLTGGSYVGVLRVNDIRTIKQTP